MATFKSYEHVQRKGSPQKTDHNWPTPSAHPLRVAVLEATFAQASLSCLAAFLSSCKRRRAIELGGISVFFSGAILQVSVSGFELF